MAGARQARVLAGVDSNDPEPHALAHGGAEHRVHLPDGPGAHAAVAQRVDVALYRLVRDLRHLPPGPGGLDVRAQHLLVPLGGARL